MPKKVFLFKIVDTDDRDCVGYIENQPMRWECDHYFGRPKICGANYSNSDFPDYGEIKTILTENEYNQFLEFDRAIAGLGYGIKKDDDRYQQGVSLCEAIQPVYGKLNSAENMELFDEIWEEEKEYLYDEYGLNDDECEEIANEYAGDYRDRGIVCCVFDDAKDCGYEEATSLGYVDSEDDSVLSRYFDFERFGQDLADDDENYYELSDGRIVRLSY